METDNEVKLQTLNVFYTKDFSTVASDRFGHKHTSIKIKLTLL